MAGNKSVNAPSPDGNLELDNFEEKMHQQGGPTIVAPSPKVVSTPDEDDDENIDALIDDLESEDGHGGVNEGEEDDTLGSRRTVPEGMLQTDSRVGLAETEVVARRRKYGLNQMKEEKENLILKFFGYFIGPIQFVMEVCLFYFFSCCFVIWVRLYFMTSQPI